MKKVFFVLLITLYWPLTSSANTNPEATFDYPFILGEWYISNVEPDTNQDNFLAIRLRLNSNYSFSIDIQKRDYSIEHWEGMYNASNDTIILGLDTSTPQVYSYKTTHNRLNLNGITFRKALSAPLAGVWSSQRLAGDDLQASNVQKIDLILQPDFVFMSRSSGMNGEESIKRGIYYIEDEHIVLLYENGETQSSYNLKDDTLTLLGAGTDMYAELARVR
ncbi:hypothetical protein [Vibrio ezurae]|uniref:Lipocalin-like domain-containing protein n=1 Tax=Vibrio ezurae NBRC 102218 TaxID=1219080 RepID=U3CUG9_9VIBR|nr:hypothetical protein [Vibrio ezurae]GAD81383.1 hypothetical protein VEZ01S_59_00070 [Vibrio ezurae NBRC 102218]